MSASNTFAEELLKHILQNAAVPLIGDAAGLLPAAAAGDLYVSLHTADPGAAGTQQTSETNYTGYARVAVARSGAAWTVTGNGYQNAAAVAWPAATGGNSTVTHFAIGTSASGAGKILLRGALTNSRTITNGSVPVANPGALAGAIPTNL